MSVIVIKPTKRQTILCTISILRCFLFIARREIFELQLRRLFEKKTVFFFSLSVMFVIQVLAFLALGNGLGNAWKSYPRCKYRVCSGYEWRNDWSPSIRQGQCVMQTRKGHPLYKTLSAKFRCPPTWPCSFKMQARRMCKYCFVLFGNGCGVELIGL